MPKILRIINRFNLGGPTFNAAYLTKHLAPKYDTMLLGGVKDASEDSSEFILESLDIEPKYIGDMHRSLNLRNDRKAYIEIKKAIKDFKPDIVHTHAAKAGTLGRLAAHRLKVPVIVHTFHGHVFHSYFGKTKTRLYKNIERYLAKKTSKIVAISDIQKHELSMIHKIAAPEKFEVINLGFDLERFRVNQEALRQQFRNTYSLDDHEIAVSIIGRLVPIKNHKLFIEALVNIKQKNDIPVRAFIVGDGEMRSELEAFCRLMNIDFTSDPTQKSSICFTSWIKDTERVYAGSDIIALSSLNEGTPVTLIEAQAASKPIVSVDVGGIKDIVLENKTALLSESQNVDGLYQNLLSLLNNEDLRKTMSREGEKFAFEKFHYSRLVGEMDQLYGKLLEEIN